MLPLFTLLPAPRQQRGVDHGHCRAREGNDLSRSSQTVKRQGTRLPAPTARRAPCMRKMLSYLDTRNRLPRRGAFAAALQEDDSTPAARMQSRRSARTCGHLCWALHALHGGRAWPRPAAASKHTSGGPNSRTQVALPSATEITKPHMLLSATVQSCPLSSAPQKQMQLNSQRTGCPTVLVKTKI